MDVLDDHDRGRDQDADREDEGNRVTRFRV